jgi:hypothetical protein
MDLRYQFQRFPFEYLLEFAQVNGNMLCGDDMSKKWDLLQPKCTLAKFGVELVLTKPL